MDMHIKEPVNLPKKKDLSPLIEPIEPPGFIEAASKYSDIYKKEEVVVVPEESKDEKKQLTVEEIKLAFEEMFGKLMNEWTLLVNSEIFANLRESMLELAKTTIALNDAIEKLNKKK